jgi:predicted nucleic acid-binding protein
VRYWDTSALVPLFLIETTTTQLSQLRDQDPEVHTWWGSHVECVSAITRLVREGGLDLTSEQIAHRDLANLYAQVNEVEPTEDVRQRAERCLAVHPLRAADAFQLGAALIWASERPTGKAFESLDARLREAAQREGFSVLPESLT